MLFAYGAGLLTLINPCVLPVLPIVLATALQAGRHGPALVAAGMSLSFVALGLAVTAFGRAVGLTPETVADAGAVLMIGFGLAARARPILGAVFVAVGAGLLLRVHHMLEFWALQVLPPWLMDFSASL